GVGFRHPLLGACMTVFLLSLAGVPPMAGFIGKFYLFASVIDAGHTGLALIAVVNSVISVYYYTGPVVQMYVVEGARDTAAMLPARPWLVACIALALVGTLYPRGGPAPLGVVPRRPDAARPGVVRLAPLGLPVHPPPPPDRLEQRQVSLDGLVPRRVRRPRLEPQDLEHPRLLVVSGIRVQDQHRG